jgi:hypothetical protein
MLRTTVAQRAATPKVDLDRLLAAQRGLLTRGQAIAAGLDDEAIRRELRGARWQRLLPGLYATFTGDVTLELRRMAASLYLGPESQITGIAALVWHGFRQLPPDDLLHVLVPHSTRRASRGFLRIQRTHRLDTNARRGSAYLVCSVARAVADASRLLDDLRPVRAIVAESVQRGLTTVDALEGECDLAGSSRTALLRRALTEIGTGARSAPEIELKNTLGRSAVMPEIHWNPKLVAQDGSPLPSPDGWIDDVGIALEVDSREYHLGPEQWQSTMRRHNILATHNVIVLHFTPSEIRSRPYHVRALVERAYRERLAKGDRARVRLTSPVAEEGAPLTR